MITGILIICILILLAILVLFLMNETQIDNQVKITQNQQKIMKNHLEIFKSSDVF